MAGKPVHFEIPAKDTSRAREFYGNLFGWQFDSMSGDAYTYEFQTEKTTANGTTTDTIVRDSAGVPKPRLDAAGKPVPFMVAYPEKDEKGNFLRRS